MYSKLMTQKSILLTANTGGELCWTFFFWLGDHLLPALGFPTIKYFKDGEVAFEAAEAREEAAILQLMRDPRNIELHLHYSVL